MDVRFFVTGHGRSGTKWLARLLNQNPDIKVHHEPISGDVSAYAQIREGNLSATKYLRARKASMEKIWQRFPDQGYAEVNSYLRYFVPELESVFRCPVAVLIRDGRYVVRSLMARGCYQKRNYPPIPMPGVSAFEKCCRYWADTYRRLSDLPTFTLERLNCDYEYFRRFCEILGMEPVSKVAWRSHAGRRVNVGVQDTSLPEWSAEQVNVFGYVAGDIQERFYE